MTVRFSDFAAFVIATSFLVAVFVAPYICAWHYMHPPAHRATASNAHSPSVSIRGGDPSRPGQLRSTMGREQGASEYGVRHAPGSLDAIEAGRGLAFGDGAARWISEVTASAVDRTDRSRDPVRPPVQQDGKAGAPSPSHLQTLANSAAHLCGVDAPLLMSLFSRESEWRADAVSSAGAVGIGQLMPRTARMMGVTDRRDPWQNMLGSACYLRMMLDKAKGNVRLALVYYHRGPNARGKTPQASHDYASDVIQGAN